MSFSDFEAVFGTGELSQKAGGLDKYKDILPNSLLAYWAKNGWRRYMGGTFWFVNPEFYKDILPELFDSVQFTAPIVFARTAFADFYFMNEGKIYFYDLQYCMAHKVADDIEEFLQLICQADEVETNLKQTIFYEAQGLGHKIRDHDQCYTFVPIPALGGSESADTIQVKSMLPYMSIVSQAVQGDTEDEEESDGVSELEDDNSGNATKQYGSFFDSGDNCRSSHRLEKTPGHNEKRRRVDLSAK
ncbi:MAG: DUF1851 domain-containing protein [Gammaproteobacteria bacterium]|nr:DUF1851 domain-containing protein [Gammaproteobacteria bacterium]